MNEIKNKYLSQSHKKIYVVTKSTAKGHMPTKYDFQQND